MCQILSEDWQLRYRGPFIRGWQGHDEVGVLFRFVAL